MCGTLAKVTFPRTSRLAAKSGRIAFLLPLTSTLQEMVRDGRTVYNIDKNNIFHYHIDFLEFAKRKVKKSLQKKRKWL